MEPGVLVASVALWLVSIFVAGRITAGKGRYASQGWFLGFLLSWIGVVICLLLSDRRSTEADVPLGTHRECPHCKELMRRDATTCPHCRSTSRPWTLHEGHWWYATEGGKWYALDEQANEWREVETDSENAQEPLPLEGGS